MSAASIRAKVAAGLRKAIEATGSDNSKKVYLIQEVKVSGGGYPGDPDVYDTSYVELVDAIVKSFDPRDIDGQNIKFNDVKIICGGTVEVNFDDKLLIGDGMLVGGVMQGQSYDVKSTGPSKPGGIVLSYSIHASEY